MAKIIGTGSGVHSPEFHKKKRREIYIRRALILLVLAVVVGVPVYLARTSRFLISSVEVSGNKVTKSADLQSIIADDLAGSYLWIFPHSNTAIYPKGAITRDLLTKEPRLSSVYIERVGRKGLKVTVAERSAVAEYCRDTKDPSAPDDCYFIDDTGYIFAPAPAFSGNVYMVYTSAEPYQSPIGQTLMDAGEFARVRDFVKSLGAIGVYPRVFLLTQDEYHIELSNGAELLWKRAADLADVATSLESFLDDKSVKSDPSFLSRVAYIDMRFGNKIFYKFRGE